MTNKSKMKMKITGKKLDGTEFLKKIETDVTELSLRNNKLQTLDLTPIKECTELTRLWLSKNQLQAIDLAPLKGCSELKELHLDYNQLQAIDLIPIKESIKLKGLYLGDNQLQTLDLTPIKGCTELRGLGLRKNQLQAIDLTPIKGCTDLRRLGLGINQLQAIDLTPIKGCTELTSLWLGNNQLQAIDLTPIKECYKLKVLYLHYNQLQEIDLAPLKYCENLEFLSLDSDIIILWNDEEPLFEHRLPFVRWRNVEQSSRENKSHSVSFEEDSLRLHKIKAAQENYLNLKKTKVLQQEDRMGKYGFFKEKIPLDEFFNIMISSVAEVGDFMVMEKGFYGMGDSAYLIGFMLDHESLITGLYVRYQFNPRNYQLANVVNIGKAGFPPTFAVERPFHHPEIVAYTLLELRRRNEATSVLKDTILKNNKIICSHCDNQIANLDEPLSSSKVIPIPQKLYRESNFSLLWMCKHCYGLLNPPDAKISETQEFYDNYETTILPLDY